MFGERVVMKDVHLHDYIVETEEIKKTLAPSCQMMTNFPLEEVTGSRFRTCTCGAPRMMGVPCMHMVVALKSGSVKGIIKNNFMP
jgi:hypothetical protein